MTDISARPVIDADLLSFSVPLSMFKEMEDNVPGSFLINMTGKKSAERISERNNYCILSYKQYALCRVFF
ncbi:hypothetical protein [Sporomusa sp.]|uniref:hypothetical protein n=1 Tax=Sporomusa sp. TaxID=2078658 RepID=UPI002B5F39FF|nr:hypothetical protein [Sporomusa sp.]HWR43067.1 hypothetical protein [Sporomusa sp.]